MIVSKQDFERKIIIDDDPDTSWLGVYADYPENQWAIDRKRRGDKKSDEYRYWNPCNYTPPGNLENWRHVSDDRIHDALILAGLPVMPRAQAIRALDLHYIEQDYLRNEALHRGDWHCVGIHVSVDLVIPLGNSTVIQTIESPGLWGIESDSGEDCFNEVLENECAQLTEILQGMGIEVVDE